MVIDIISSIVSYVFLLFGYISNEKLFPEPLSKSEEDYLIKKHFNKEAEAFDEQVQKNIPCYNEMLTALINAIPDNNKNPKILT